MAQRRVRTQTRMTLFARRMGLSGGRLAACGLIVLACLGAGIGFVMMQPAHQFALERGPVAADETGEEIALQERSDDASHVEPVGDTADAEEPVVKTYRVHVDGAVANPGVIEISGDDVRVDDAVSLCGGLTEGADTTLVNLAEPLVDGAKIHIPEQGEQQVVAPGSAAAGQATSSGGGGGAPTQALININTATVEELQQLKGIGEVTAQAIVDERTNNGPFASVEDLMRVSGIGQKKFEAVQGSICV